MLNDHTTFFPKLLIKSQLIKENVWNPALEHPTLLIHSLAPRFPTRSFPAALWGCYIPRIFFLIMAQCKTMIIRASRSRIRIHLGVHLGIHSGVHLGIHSGVHLGIHSGVHLGIHSGVHLGIHTGVHLGIHSGVHLGVHSGVHLGIHCGVHLGIHSGVHLGIHSGVHLWIHSGVHLEKCTSSMIRPSSCILYFDFLHNHAL